MVYPLLNPCPQLSRGKNRPGVGCGSRSPLQSSFPRGNAKMHRRGGPPASFPRRFYLCGFRRRKKVYSPFSVLPKPRASKITRRSNLTDFLPRHAIATTCASAEAKPRLPVCTLSRPLLLKDPGISLPHSSLSPHRSDSLTSTPPRGCSRDLWPRHPA